MDEADSPRRRDTLECAQKYCGRFEAAARNETGAERAWVGIQSQDGLHAAVIAFESDARAAAELDAGVPA
jgi:hypothetical protein